MREIFTKQSYIASSYLRATMTQGEILRAWRIKKGLEQMDIHALGGPHPGTQSEIENGHRSARIDTLKKYAKALGVSVEDLSHMPSTDVTPTVQEVESLLIKEANVSSMKEMIEFFKKHMFASQGEADDIDILLNMITVIKHLSKTGEWPPKE